MSGSQPDEMRSPPNPGLTQLVPRRTRRLHPAEWQRRIPESDLIAATHIWRAARWQGFGPFRSISASLPCAAGPAPSVAGSAVFPFSRERLLARKTMVTSDPGVVCPASLPMRQLQALEDVNFKKVPR